MNWKTGINVTGTPRVIPQQPLTPTAKELQEAGKRFEARTDYFAEGKAQTCFDLARRLEQHGSYASEKQQGFAAKLVEWSLPRERQWRDPMALQSVPKLFDVLQRHSVFHADRVKLQRKNQDTLCWIILDDQCVGKIENGSVSLFMKKLGTENATFVRSILREFNEDPLVAAMKYGKLSGRCCSCGRDLTDPASIEAGIGPICARRF